MTETEKIALEISEMIRAHWRGEGVQEADVYNAVDRILKSPASTPLDALALLTFAKRILVDTPSDEQQANHSVAMSLIHKASEALETATSTSAAKYEGAIWN